MIIEEPQVKPILIAGRHRSPILIHYGSKRYNPKKVQPIINTRSWGIKPGAGGLWTSPIDSEKGWEEFCGPYLCARSPYFTLLLKEESNILVIDSKKDLEGLPIITDCIMRTYLDFEKIAKKYDALWLTDKGERTIRSFPVTEISFYAWDCETVLIFNSECCTPYP